ncbi:MAG TPA: protein CapI, partial [Aquabacterium sp.]|nr:protein CapI [Aquabacterium sp.]
DEAFRREQPTPASSWAPYRVFNIGHSEPVALMDFIGAMESALGKTALKDFQPMQPGDVVATYADVDALKQWTGASPHTSLDTGVKAFAEWYVGRERP